LCHVEKEWTCEDGAGGCWDYVSAHNVWPTKKKIRKNTGEKGAGKVSLRKVDRRTMPNSEEVERVMGRRLEGGVGDRTESTAGGGRRKIETRFSQGIKGGRNTIDIWWNIAEIKNQCLTASLPVDDA